jgi:hypothetical protein
MRNGLVNGGDFGCLAFSIEGNPDTADAHRCILGVWQFFIGGQCPPYSGKLFYWWAVPTLRVPYAYSKWPNVGWALPTKWKKYPNSSDVPTLQATSTTAAKYMLNLIVRCAFS